MKVAALIFIDIGEIDNIYLGADNTSGKSAIQCIIAATARQRVIACAA